MKSDQVFFSPRLPMLLLSFSTSSTPTLIKSAIPKITNTFPNTQGVAFSLYFVFEALGQIFGHVFLGYLRQNAADYDQCVTAMVCISLFASCRRK